MPLQRCERDGKPGWQWGRSGKCYVYEPGDKDGSKRAKKRAIKQAIAIGGGRMPERFSEYVDNHGQRLKVDAGVIRGVKILGKKSKNGRTYSDDAIRRAAEQYDGARVNIDHTDGPRSYRDRIGNLTDIRIENDGLYGTLRYNPKHPLAEQLAWDAEHNPASVGMSHDIEGSVRLVKGKGPVVEEIKRVRSVDLVAEPATTDGLFEAEMTRKAINDLPDSAFAYIEPGGKKDESGKTMPRSLRHFPIHDAAHARNALARIPQSKLPAAAKSKALRKAKAAAKQFAIKLAKEEVMDDLTLDGLKAERPDLVKAISDAAVASLREELDRVTKERDALQEQAEHAERINAAREALEKAGWPAEAITEQRLEIAAKLDAEELQEFVKGVRAEKPRSKEQETGGIDWLGDAKKFAEQVVIT